MGQSPTHTGPSLGGLLPPLPQSPMSVAPPVTNLTFLPALASLVSRIRAEFEQNPTLLLKVNPSRREAIAQHIDRLAGTTRTGNEKQDSATILKQLINGPRSPQQNSALLAFFEEIALFVVAQSLLLKAWSDRGIRTWREADLAHLNSSLDLALKPHVPLDREGWQITQRNLYSWYNPSPTIQQQIWQALSSWQIADEGPALLDSLMRLARQYQPRWPEFIGYDRRFFMSLWDHMSEFGLDLSEDQTYLRKRKVAFTPTLREGTLARLAPDSLNWLGTEDYPLQLFAAEFAQLWWGPSAPPAWAIGNGLDAHPRDQLQLALGSPKPSLVSRIAEMEACELSFVFEERAVRTNGRNVDSLRFRDQLDHLPYFKKLRGNNASLGLLQACVAVSKLRPDGLCWWFREEPISANDGSEALSFILDRAQLICEWNFSAISHALPSTTPLFPKYIYLLRRTTNVEARLSHRPLRITMRGQIRSHIELPLLLQDALQSVERAIQPRGHWQAQIHRSPTTQKEWAERWPEPADTDQLQAIEVFRSVSVPLASVATVRQPSGANGTPGTAAAQDWAAARSSKGIWIQMESNEDKQRLAASPLPVLLNDTRQQGLMVLVSDESWVAPLAAYLESQPVQLWLDHNAERRNGKLVLSEQIAKFIPVHKALLQAMGVPGTPGTQGIMGDEAVLDLDTGLENLAAQACTHPTRVMEQVARVQGDSGTLLRATIFVRAARMIAQLQSANSRLFGLVRQDGRIRWDRLLDILPKNQLTFMTMHPDVRIQGNVPAHMPIGRIERVKTPMTGILFVTEAGQHCCVGSERTHLLDMLWDQLQDVHHLTWSELVQGLRLPRNVEVAEITANDVLRSHGEQSARIRDLSELLKGCSSF